MNTRFDVAWLLIPLLLGPISHAQELSSRPGEGAKVCVAVVTNRTKSSLMVDRMTERLTRSIAQNRLDAVAIESETTGDRQLHPTMQNGAELKDHECDFLVLTQVAEVQNVPGEPPDTNISIGRRTPSVDAADPMGGSSGPVYRSNVEVRFALFRPGHVTADLDTNILAQPSGHASDSLLSAMDRVANRVSHEVKKK